MDGVRTTLLLVVLGPRAFLAMCLGIHSLIRRPDGQRSLAVGLELLRPSPSAESISVSDGTLGGGEGPEAVFCPAEEAA